MCFEFDKTAQLTRCLETYANGWLIATKSQQSWCHFFFLIIITHMSFHWIASNDILGARGGQEVMLKKVAFLDYKSITENNKLWCKQRKSLGVFSLFAFLFFNETCHVISLLVKVWAMTKIHKLKKTTTRLHFSGSRLYNIYVSVILYVHLMNPTLRG